MRNESDSRFILQNTELVSVIYLSLGGFKLAHALRGKTKLNRVDCCFPFAQVLNIHPSIRGSTAIK